MTASTSPFKSPGLRKLSNTSQMQQQPCRQPRCLKRRGSLWLKGCTNVSPVRRVGHRDPWGSCAPVPFLHPGTANTTQPLLRASSAHGRSFCCLNLFIYCCRVTTYVALAGCPPHAGPPHCREPIVGEWCADYFSPRLQAACGCVHPQVEKYVFYQEPVTHQSNEEQNTDG